MPLGGGLVGSSMMAASGMGTRVGSAFVEVFADTSGLRRGFADAETLTRSFGARMSAASMIVQRTGATITRNLSIPLLAVGGLSVKMASDFETAMTRTRVLADAGSATIDGVAVSAARMREEVLKLSQATGESAKDIADALFFVGSAGLENEQVFPVLEKVVKGAAAQLGDAATLGELLTSVLVAYQKDAPNAARAMDILLSAVREGKAEPADLSASLGTVIPVAAEMAVSFDEVAGAIAASTNVGINAARAATGLRYMLIQLQNPSETAKNTMEDFNLSVGQVQHAISQDLLGGLKMMADAFDLSTVKGREAFFTAVGGVRAGQVALALIGKSYERTQSIMNATSKAAQGMGANFEGAYQKMRQTPERVFARAWNELRLAAIEAGTALLPIAKDIVEAIANVAKAFSELPDGVQGAIVKFGLFVIAAGPLITALGAIWRAISAVILAFEAVPAATTAAAAATTAAAPAMGAAKGATTVIGAQQAALAAAPAAAPTALGAVTRPGLARIGAIGRGLGTIGLYTAGAIAAGASIVRIVDDVGTSTEELERQTGLTGKQIDMFSDQIALSGAAFNFFGSKADKTREAGTIVAQVYKEMMENGWSLADAQQEVNKHFEAASQDVGGLTGSMDTLNENLRARLGLLDEQTAKEMGARRFEAVLAGITQQATEVQGLGGAVTEDVFDPTSVKEFRDMMVSLEESGIDATKVLAGPLGEALRERKIDFNELEDLFGRFEIPFAEVGDKWLQQAILIGEGTTKAKTALADMFVTMKGIGIDPMQLQGVVDSVDNVMDGTGTLSEVYDAFWSETAPHMVDAVADISGSLKDGQREALAMAIAGEDWLRVMRLIDRYESQRERRRRRAEKRELGVWDTQAARDEAEQFFQLSERFGEAWAQILAPPKGGLPMGVTRTLQNFEDLGLTLKDLPKQERIELKVAVDKGNWDRVIDILLDEIARLDGKKAEPEVDPKTEGAKGELDDVEHSMNTIDNMNATPSVSVGGNAQSQISAIISRLNTIDNMSVEGTVLIRQITERTGWQTGGWVGGAGRGDIVPLMAEPGEFVVRRDVARRHPRFLESFNRGDLTFHRPAGRGRPSSPVMSMAGAGARAAGGDKSLTVNVQGKMEYSPDDLRRNLEGWWRRRDW